MTDNQDKAKMLRYAQLTFQKQKGTSPLTPKEEEELVSLPKELDMTPEAIIKAVTESILANM
ncbi:MAG TPA: hypothetical protein VL335_00380 [Candidatus Paceibacterota bacterium]|nr:hypothetical protein [Candidatus Paceibacterota bacterium]